MEEVDIDELVDILRVFSVFRTFSDEIHGIHARGVNFVAHNAFFGKFLAVFILLSHCEGDVHVVALVKGIHAVEHQFEPCLRWILFLVVLVLIEHMENDGQLIFVIIADGFCRLVFFFFLLIVNAVITTATGESHQYA